VVLQEMKAAGVAVYFNCEGEPYVGHDERITIEKLQDYIVNRSSDSHYMYRTFAGSDGDKRRSVIDLLLHRPHRRRW